MKVNVLNNRCNPFLDIPMAADRFVLMAIAATIYVSELFWAAIQGLFLFYFSKSNYEKRQQRYHERICKAFRKNLVWHPWLKHKIVNVGNEQFEKGSIIICNHQSMIDPTCLLSLSPKILFVINGKVWHNPFVAPVLRFGDFFPLQEDPKDNAELFRDRIEKGYSIVIFPEAKRSVECNILRFHQGAFLMAKDLGVDILPIFIHGPGHIVPTGRAFNCPASLYIEIGRRIHPDDTTFGVTPKEMQKNFHDYYLKHYHEICLKTETPQYFFECVTRLFGKVGKKRFARRLLSTTSYDFYPQELAAISVPDEPQRSIVVDEDSCGVIAMMMALVHPDILIITPPSAELQRLLAKNKNLPKNIRFQEV